MHYRYFCALTISSACDNVKVFIETYGCTANKSDSDAIAAMLKNARHIVSKTLESSDTVVVNSCGVKDAAEKKIIHRVKELHKTGRKVVLCGCLPYINIERTKTLAERGVDIVGLDKKKLEGIFGMPGKKRVDAGRGPERMFTEPIARIPICSGCLSNCTFCATRLARGRLKSNSRTDILGWISDAVGLGAKEIQLTGQDIGCYGLDNDASLGSLLHDIERIEGDFKVRLGMFNPNYIDRLPKDIFAGERFYRFVHIPVQSGNDGVLNDMKRPYKAHEAMEFIRDLRDEFGDKYITFWTDLIVGFPTEDDGAFHDSIDFISNTRPDCVNVSRFWPRPRTVAAGMKQLPVTVMKRRSAEMTALCDNMTFERNKQHIGSREEISILEYGTKETLKGRTDSYNQVIIKQNMDKRDGNRSIGLGSRILVDIGSATCTGLIGTITNV